MGGTNWIDVDTVVYNKSLILTYNYAYGGATIDASLVAPYEPTVLSLIDQVNQFLTTVASKPASTPWTSANSLFSIWIGINDIGNSYYLGGDRDAYGHRLIDCNENVTHTTCYQILGHSPDCRICSGAKISKSTDDSSPVESSFMTFLFSVVRMLFALLSESPCNLFLSDVGARNFLFINVPPIDRSPLVRPGCPLCDLYSDGIISRCSPKTLPLKPWKKL